MFLVFVFSSMIVAQFRVPDNGLYLVSWLLWISHRWGTYNVGLPPPVWETCSDVCDPPCSMGVLNDFEANGYGILALQPEDVVILNDVPAAKQVMPLAEWPQIDALV
jgi:hypothetical protein